jgi:serine/threonine protein kinase
MLSKATRCLLRSITDASIPSEPDVGSRQQCGGDWLSAKQTVTTWAELLGNSASGLRQRALDISMNSVDGLVLVSDLKPDQHVAGWQLLNLLGEGGNAEVWRCRREDGDEAAVKFLKTRKVESRRWQRFRREVEYLASLGAEPGVLPIIDFDLPDAPRKGERAWYSMPIATPLSAALGDANLREVVEAISPISRVLSALAQRDGAAHRDVKPSNLYRWQEQSAVGDFGLLWRPEQTDITGSEIPGAFSFTAPELFRDDLAEEAIDYSRADVFSLAKTLWAIARGQEFAIPGPHDPGESGVAIGEFRQDAASSALDRLIERATVANPTRRPDMGEFGDELERWLELAGPTSTLPDLSSVAGQIREQMEPTLEREQNERRLIDFGRSAVRRCRERLTPLFERLESDLPNARTNVRDSNIEGMLKTYAGMGAPEVLMRETVCAVVSNMEDPIALLLAFGVMVEVVDDGTLNIAAAMQLGYEKVMQNESDRTELRSIPAGSVEDEAAVREATDWIAANVEAWLKRFAETSQART